MSSNQELLLQAQADRFALNWRRVTPNQRYPRYMALRPEMESQLRSLDGDVRAVAPSSRFDLVELTYVNVFLEESGHVGLPLLSNYLRAVTPIGEASFLSAPEDTRFQSRWVIEREGSPVGRLYASAEPGFLNEDQRPVYALSMTARMVAEGSGVNEVMELFDLAHDWIVRAFKDITTPAMHERWGHDREMKS